MNKLGFWYIFLCVIVAEIPCILRTTALQIRNDGVGSIIGGTLAANAVALFFGILLAKIFVNVVPSDYADLFQNFAGLVFIILGLFMFCGGHECNH